MSDGNPAQLCLYVYTVLQEHLASNNWIIFCPYWIVFFLHLHYFRELWEQFRFEHMHIALKSLYPLSTPLYTLTNRLCC